MGYEFKKAKREQIYVKILLGGPSGSGKTYSALRLATGMFKESGGEGIAVIDTENKRVRYYANEFEFFDIQLEDFSPKSYMNAVQAAIDAGFKILIIDSITHEWNYCLELHDKMPGNSYTNWGKVAPQHEAFMEMILQCPIHIIATVRGKDEYVLEERNGKQAPKKVGVGYKQRDNIEYNYTVTFNLSQDTHVADPTKDNTHIFEGRFDVLTEKDGKLLYDWANSGEKAEETIESLIISIKRLFSRKIDTGVSKDILYGIVAEYNDGEQDFRKIKNMDVCKKIINAMNEI